MNILHNQMKLDRLSKLICNSGGAVAIQADVPLSELFGYVTDLRTITSGRANSTMEFSHYAAAPKGIAEEIIEKAKGTVKV